MGRPSVDAPGILEAICERLIAGESMRTICADETMPVSSQVYLRMTQKEEFRSAIARAREAQQEALIDETVDMADAATAEDHQVVKLRIWARQWRASKLAPKRYGDRVTNEHVGADGGPIQTESRSSRDLAKAVAAMLSKGLSDGEADGEGAE